MMLVWLGIAAFSLAGQVRVEPLIGPEAVGTLRALSSEQVTLETSAGTKSWRNNQLLGVRLTDRRDEDVMPKAWIYLRDGSVLLAERFSVVDRKAEVELPDGLTVSFRTALVGAVRFRAPSASLDKSWSALTQTKVDSDKVIVRKGADTLDELEGVLHDVNDRQVQFQVDEDKVSIGRERLEGIVYFQASPRELPRSVCTVLDRFGSAWRVKELKLDGEQITATTCGGLLVSLPVDRVRQLDFASGNVKYLSDLEPDSVQRTPYFTIATLTTDSLQPPYRRDASWDGNPLRLASKTYKKGLAMTGRTELSFRLTEPFQRFIAVAGIDDEVRPEGHVELVILADDRELLRVPLSGDDAPLPIDLDIAGVRRLRILVDHGQQADLGDHLDLCDARITK